jgi:hypothetical protein
MPAMTVGQLRAFMITNCELPDDAPVIIESKHCFKATEAVEGFADPVNRMGMTHASSEKHAKQIPALLFLDRSES